MTEPQPAQHDREALSALLRRLRGLAGLSGAAAARGAGFSQSKLSKLETGMLLLSAADAEALCHVYQASAEQRDELLALVARLATEYDSARVILQRGAYRKQQEIGRVEAESTLLREFQPAYVIGLAQTPAYMRRLFEPQLGAAEAQRAVAARLERQHVIDDPAREFRLVMTEGALRWRVGPAQVMAEQIDHLVDMSRLPNVRLGIIPWTVEANVFPGHAFHIYDQRLVIVGILTATATIRDPRDVAEYGNLFTELEQLAVYDDPARGELARIGDAYRASVE
jgi:transcriptional regulator with XRE-family HTH domain